jgi:hypothetical protein
MSIRFDSSPVSLVLISFAGLMALGACQPKAKEEAKATQAVADSKITTPPSQPEAPKAAPHANAPAHTDTSKAEKADNAAGGKAVTIAGGWVNAGGACDSGASVFFNPDGTYLSEGEKGTWSLAGKTLTVTTNTTFDEASPSVQGPDESTGDVGEKTVLTLLNLTDDTAQVVLSNGSNARWTRCTG